MDNTMMGRKRKILAGISSSEMSVEVQYTSVEFLG